MSLKENDIAKESAYEGLKEEVMDLIDIWGEEEIKSWLVSLVDELEEI